MHGTYHMTVGTTLEQRISIATHFDVQYLRKVSMTVAGDRSTGLTRDLRNVVLKISKIFQPGTKVYAQRENVYRQQRIIL